MKVCAAMDQIPIPDPVAQELCRMELHIARLEKELIEMRAAAEDTAD